MILMNGNMQMLHGNQSNGMCLMIEAVAEDLSQLQLQGLAWSWGAHTEICWAGGAEPSRDEGAEFLKFGDV
jgi:hypothetical protein